MNDTQAAYKPYIKQRDGATWVPYSVSVVLLSAVPLPCFASKHTIPHVQKRTVVAASSPQLKQMRAADESSRRRWKLMRAADTASAPCWLSPSLTRRHVLMCAALSVCCKHKQHTHTHKLTDTTHAHNYNKSSSSSSSSPSPLPWLPPPLPLSSLPPPTPSSMSWMRRLACAV
jgi:hypothetical protein